RHRPVSRRLGGAGARESELPAGQSGDRLRAWPWRADRRRDRPQLWVRPVGGGGPSIRREDPDTVALDLRRERQLFPAGIVETAGGGISDGRRPRRLSSAAAGRQRRPRVDPINRRSGAVGAAPRKVSQKRAVKRSADGFGFLAALAALAIGRIEQLLAQPDRLWRDLDQ